MSLPVISVEQMRQWEQETWATGQTESEVIRRVGQAVAQRAFQLTKHGDQILFLAGKGNNGNDARAAQQFLRERGVHVLNVENPRVAREEFRALLARRPALLVDGLFGIGLNRPLDEAWCSLIEAMNATGLRVLSVDGPSGLNVTTGEPEGAAVRATVTLTVGAPKEGLLKRSAWPYVGRLEVATGVDLAACSLASDVHWTEAGDLAGFPPARPAFAHKGAFGHAVILAGTLGYHGASVLAARGAQRARPGLITLFTQEASYFPVAAQMQSVMVSPWNVKTGLDQIGTAVLVGPGLANGEPADDFRTVIRRLWKDCEHPVVADASALDWLNYDAGPRGSIRVMTPHPGEAARMLQTSADEIQSDRVRSVRRLSDRYGDVWVVLKGHQTLIGRSEGTIFVNSTGNAGLAQGGSGDALAGYLVGLLAQPELQQDPLQTIRHAVWEHGHTADRLEKAGGVWTIEDLLSELGNADERGC